MKKVWCREKRTFLGEKKPSEKRWRCPDCKQRFEVVSVMAGCDPRFYGPAHKKREK